MVLRVALAITAHPPQAWLAVIAGAPLDLLVGLVAMPLLVLGIAFGGGLIARPRWRQVILVPAMTGLVFLILVEWFFVDEFGTRFNHVALDYLLYPYEVVTNIGQSYNLPLWIGVAGAAGGILALAVGRFAGVDLHVLSWRQRGIAAGMTLACMLAGLAGLAFWPRTLLGDRRSDTVAANGVVELVHAALTARLPYAEHYRTLAEPRARALAQAEFGWADSARPAKTLLPNRPRDRPLDVVVVLEESLGSEFVGRLGGLNPCTPGLDRWSHEGLLLTNLIATGNRTVRGLEGVLCSFAPLPGDSVWKRAHSQGMATVAGVMRAAGYQTAFVYGGAGTFDNMKAFALSSGWDEFIEDGLVASAYPAAAFRTAWGVADEHAFAALLERQRQAARAGTPLFATLLTTSNHKPFLTPATRDPRRSSARVAKWSMIAGGMVCVLVGLWFAAGRRIGRVRLLMVGALALAVIGIWASVKLQAKDSRENAVRYADSALAGWLDSARAQGLLDHTVVLIVGDHGARVYGAADIPVASYRVPGLFITPDANLRGRTIDRLCSQIDLAPTLLSLAGVAATVPFCGNDLLAGRADGPGRAFVIHNRDIGLLTDDHLVVLGLQRSVHWFARSGRDQDVFTPMPPPPPGSGVAALADRAAACFQVLDEIDARHDFRLVAHPR